MPAAEPPRATHLRHDTVMLDTSNNADVSPSGAPASVHDALVRVTGLLRKHRLVEGLVREQGGLGVIAARRAACSADSSAAETPK